MQMPSLGQLHSFDYNMFKEYVYHTKRTEPPEIVFPKVPKKKQLKNAH